MDVLSFHLLQIIIFLQPRWTLCLQKSSLNRSCNLKLQLIKEHQVRLFGSEVEAQQLKHQQANLKIHGHFDKSSIQTIVLSLIQYKAHSVSPFICTNRAGGNRKHLIKSKLIFQQFELAELCYDGTRRRRIEAEEVFSALLPGVSGCCLMYFYAVSHQSLIICSSFPVFSLLTNKHIMHLGACMKIPFCKMTLYILG